MAKKTLGKILFFVSAGLMLCSCLTLPKKADYHLDRCSAGITKIQVSDKSVPGFDSAQEDYQKFLKENNLRDNPKNQEVYLEQFGETTDSESPEIVRIRDNINKSFYDFRKPSPENSYEYNKFFPGIYPEKPEIKIPLLRFRF